tara:strand:- start:175 stop:468 length:294 start_codon:yes stop_codon:yes gene_type:complete
MTHLINELEKLGFQTNLQDTKDHIVKQKKVNFYRNKMKIGSIQLLKKRQLIRLKFMDTKDSTFIKTFKLKTEWDDLLMYLGKINCESQQKDFWQNQN